MREAFSFLFYRGEICGRQVEWFAQGYTTDWERVSSPDNAWGVCSRHRVVWLECIHHIAATHRGLVPPIQFSWFGCPAQQFSSSGSVVFADEEDRTVNSCTTSWFYVAVTLQ